MNLYKTYSKWNNVICISKLFEIDGNKRKFFRLIKTRNWVSLEKIEYEENKTIKWDVLSYWINFDKIEYIQKNISEWLEWFLNKFEELEWKWKEFIDYLNSTIQYIMNKKDEEWLFDFWIEEIDEQEKEEPLSDIEEFVYSYLKNDKIWYIIKRETRNFEQEPEDFVKSMNLLVMKDYLSYEEDKAIELISKLENQYQLNNIQIKWIIIKIYKYVIKLNS